MAVRVSPTLVKSTHHISLTDGDRSVGLIVTDPTGAAKPRGFSRTPLNRTALKTSAGVTKYADFDLPWAPIVSEDWSGGRAQNDFDTNTVRYYDNHNSNPLFGPIMLGPLPKFTKGYRSMDFSLPGSLSWEAIRGAQTYFAVRFTASASYSVVYLWAHIRKVGTPASALTVELRSTSAGSPGTVLQSTTLAVASVTDIESIMRKFTITAQAITSGTQYWICLSSAGGTDENHWEVGVKNAVGTSKISAAGSTWATTTKDMYYMATAANPAAFKPRFFRYKYLMYCIVSGETGAPNLYQLGDRGLADANTGALGTLVDGIKNWTTDQWVGCVVYVFKGPGSAESKPYRVITANSSTVLTVDSPWLIEHTTDTEYVILNSEEWIEITGHGLSAPVTDLCICNNMIYFAQGDAVNMRRAEWYNNSGVAAWRYADDGTNKASYVCTVRDTTNGLEFWKGNNADASGFVSGAKAPPATTWANMTFATAIPFYDDNGKINGLCEYGSSVKVLWCFRERTVFAMSDGASATRTWDEIPLKEISALADETNGSAYLVHNVYIYFTLGTGLEKYISPNMYDIGPNRDEALPNDRQGVISSLSGYPGRFFASVDGDTLNYSSILCNNIPSDGAGWHEFFRAGNKGDRIKNLFFDATKTIEPNRLWFDMGGLLCYLEFPSLTIYPYRDVNVGYTHEGSLITGYMYSGLIDCDKIYNSVKLRSEDLVADAQTVKVQYMTDNETVWHDVGLFDTSPVQEIFLGRVKGKRIRFRIILYTTDYLKTPRVLALIVDSVVRIPVRYTWVFNYRSKDYDVDLEGKPDDLTASEKQAILDEWAENFTPLTMSHYKNQLFDNKSVYIEPISLVDSKENKTIRENANFLGKLVVTQL